MKDKYQVSLKAIIKNAKGEFLGLTSPQDSGLAGSYEFAGGRIEVDEFTTQFSEILKREIAEELGDIQYDLKLNPVALGRHLTSGGTRVLYVFFEALYHSGEIRISDEHDGYAWLDLTNKDLSTLFRSGNLEGISMYLKR